MIESYIQFCSSRPRSGSRAAPYATSLAGGDPKRKLTDSERLAIVHKVDEILGLRSPDHDDHESNPAPHPEIASFDS